MCIIEKDKHITVDKLKPGDVLLYRGNSRIARAIRYFDGTDVNHAGLYLGKDKGEDKVGEVLFQGVITRSLHESIQDCEWVKVVRHQVSDAGDDMVPVIKKAECYLKRKDRYAFEQILLLALVCSAQRIDYSNSPALKAIAHAATTTAKKVFSVMQKIKPNCEPMICSEFVYRSFDEALPEKQDRYSIQFDAPTIATKNLLRDYLPPRPPPYPNDTANGLGESPPPDAHDSENATNEDESKDPIHQYRKELEDLIEKFRSAIETDHRDSVVAPSVGDIPIETLEYLPTRSFVSAFLKQKYEMRDGARSTSILFPNLVTPGDLLKSPSLQNEVGRFEVHKPRQ